ncbi:EamA family transporter [Nocardioides mesophilus]|uniref:EamA family transporter n=1 Tax=Nocardioides mesophilus TaxID=433659 RepID=A0A7G9RFA7_9ACTN|nr:EamA family transporter [Nocardioides mesophilus]QNN54282.1 EamA family transporter [Nocardioides mesophilus]
MSQRVPGTAGAPGFGLVMTALVVVYVVWGSTYLGIRIVVEEAPPLTSMGLRYATAGVLLGAVLTVRGGLRRLRLTRRQALGAAALGLFLPVLGNGMVSVAENLGAPSGVTALLIAIAPLIIVVFRVAEGDRPGPLTLAGVLLGFAGLAVLVLLGRGGAGDFPLGAALLVLFASSCWALGSYLQPRLPLPEDVFVTTVYEMLFGGAMLTVLGFVSGERFTGDYSARTWLALAYLVVFGSVVAFTAYVWLLDSAPISLVATYAYVNPVVAVFLGWLVLSEAVTGAVLAGGAIVVLAVALVITAERPRRTPEVALASSGEPLPETAADGDLEPTG